MYVCLQKCSENVEQLLAVSFGKKAERRIYKHTFKGAPFKKQERGLGAKIIILSPPASFPHEDFYFFLTTHGPPPSPPKMPRQ